MKYVLLLLLCIMLTGCSNEEVIVIPEETDNVITLEPIVTVEPIATPEPIQPIIDIEADIVVNNVSISLPVSLSTLNELGWTLFPNINSETIGAGESVDNLKIANSNLSNVFMDINVCNFSDEPCSISDCYVTKIVAFESDGLTVSVGFAILGDYINEGAFSDTTCKVYVTQDEYGKVSSLGVEENSLKDITKIAPSVNWHEDMSLTIDDMTLSLTSSFSNTVIQENGWYVEDDNLDCSSYLRDDTILTLYRNSDTITGVCVKEREVCVNLNFYGITCCSDLKDIEKVFGDDYYSYYICDNKTLVSYNIDNCYCTFVLTGGLVNEIRLSTERCLSGLD